MYENAKERSLLRAAWQNYRLYSTMARATRHMTAKMGKGVRISFSFPYATRVSEEVYRQLKGRKTGVAQIIRPRASWKMSNTDIRSAFGPLAVSLYN